VTSVIQFSKASFLCDLVHFIGRVVKIVLPVTGKVKVKEMKTHG